MKKRTRWLSLILAAVLALSMTACGSSSSSSTSSDTDTSEASEESAKTEETETEEDGEDEAQEEEAAEDSAEEETEDDAEGTVSPGEGATKMGVILVGTRDDYGYNEALYNCVIEAGENLGIEVMVKESVPEDSSSVSVMEQMIAQGCTLIYATSYGHREYAEEVAAAHPEVAFYVTNVTGQDMDNIAAITMHLYDAAYVNGVLAGYMTETNELGYICSFQIPVVLSSINAFTLGAQSVNPDITVHAVFTGSWDDVGLQTNAVNAMVSQNIDVIAQYQDYTKTIVETCESAGVYVLGYHVDSTRDLAPNSFIGGTIDTFVKQESTFQAAIDGNFVPEVIRGGYPEGMVANAEMGDMVPEEVQEAVNEVIAAMEAGETTAFIGPVYDQEGNLVLEEGEVMDEEVLDAMDYFVEGVVGLDI